mgnify:CR=1 FL=1
MAGEGSMLHAIASLKANKRKRNHIFTKDLDSSIYTSPIVFKKSSEEECDKAAQRLQDLKNGENIRLKIAIFIISSLIILITIKLFLQQ